MLCLIAILIYNEIKTWQNIQNSVAALAILALWRLFLTPVSPTHSRWNSHWICQFSCFVMTAQARDNSGSRILTNQKLLLTNERLALCPVSDLWDTTDSLTGDEARLKNDGSPRLSLIKTLSVYFYSLNNRNLMQKAALCMQWYQLSHFILL